MRTTMILGAIVAVIAASAVRGQTVLPEFISSSAVVIHRFDETESDVGIFTVTMRVHNGGNDSIYVPLSPVSPLLAFGSVELGDGSTYSPVAETLIRVSGGSQTPSGWCMINDGAAATVRYSGAFEPFETGFSRYELSLFEYASAPLESQIQTIPLDVSEFNTDFIYLNAAVSAPEPTVLPAIAIAIAVLRRRS